MLTRLRLKSTPRSLSAWSRASVGGIIAAVLIVGLVLWLTGDTFKEAFGANFLATVGGVALGVPVAVWLTLREDAEQTRRMRTQDQERSTARRNAVLASIATELRENKESLQQRRPGTAREFHLPFLQDEVWLAMSDGGELRWVEDPVLLRQLARPYVFIRTVNYLERQWFEITHYAGMRIQGNDAEVRIAAYLDHVDTVCGAAIDEGLAAIARATPQP